MPSKKKGSVALAQRRAMPSVRRKSPLADIWSFIIWVVGLLVSLAVGFGMTGTTPVLTIPGVPVAITVLAGWIVVVLVLLGVLLKIIDKLSR